MNHFCALTVTTTRMAEEGLCPVHHCIRNIWRTAKMLKEVVQLEFTTNLKE